MSEQKYLLSSSGPGPGQVRVRLDLELGQLNFKTLELDLCNIIFGLLYNNHKLFSGL